MTLIIPVLDLMDGQVVQAIRGEREKYRPLQSVLVSTPEPLSVARALQEETGCRSFYIADLNAIQGRGDHRAVIRELAERLTADLWVDAGIADAASALDILEDGAGRVIVGSETLASVDTLRSIRAALPPERLLFSLDIQQGHVLSRSPILSSLDPSGVLDLLTRDGWPEVIILTLDRVGTGGGPDWALLSSARRRFPSLLLIAGGGVRTPGDLQAAASLGVRGVLVASALHRGWITRDDLLGPVTNAGEGPESSPTLLPR